MTADHPWALLFLVYAFYGAGTVLSLLYFVDQKTGERQWARRALLVGIAAHTLHFVLVALAAGEMVVNTPRQALFALAWSMIAVYLALDNRAHLPTVGAFLTPIALVVMAVALMVGDGAAPRSAETASSIVRVLGAGHIVLAFVGNGAFVLAFSVGVMYLLQERELKSRRSGKFLQRLPSLQDLDTLGWRCLVAGFPLLTLAILTGALWQRELGQSLWDMNAKTVWTLATWVLYAALLGVRLGAGWRGRRTAWFAIAGFTMVVATSIAVGVFLVERHVYH